MALTTWKRAHRSPHVSMVSGAAVVWNSCQTGGCWLVSFLVLDPGVCEEADYSRIPAADLPFGLPSWVRDDSWGRVANPRHNNSVERPSTEPDHTHLASAHQPAIADE
jgi:hypothetical protein